MKTRSIAWIMLLSFVITLVFSPLNLAAENAASNASGMSYLQAVMQLARNEYNFELSDQKLLGSTVKGIFNSMDDYTEFFSREEAKDFLESVDGNYVGIGVVLAPMESYIVVTRVFASSPAETAGIMSGDKIVTINNKNVIGASVDEVTGLIRGQNDSRVTLGIIRNGNKAIRSITVTRKGIKLNPVNYDIRDGIAYLSIDTFNTNTYEYLAAALDAIDTAQVNRIILDLRNNTGGDLDQSVAVAERFIPEGVITSLHYLKYPEKDCVYKSSLKKSPYKLVVLVNDMTASASEILAGAIQDSKAGKLVGIKTYGKARVQSIIPILTPEAYEKYGKKTGLVDAYAVGDLQNQYLGEEDILGWAKITVATYATPAGRMIDGQGLQPDEKVSSHEAVKDVNINSISKLQRIVKPGLNDEGIDVYNAEKILRISGYDVNIPDMTLDEKTFAAIKKFQQDHGLGSYGVLDFSTQNALNQQYYKVLPEIDHQYARALEIIGE